MSRLSLFGYRTACLVSPSANKFLFTSPALTTMNNEAFSRMVGRRTVCDVVGDEHARVRGMVVQFLRLDAVKWHVASMDAEVQRHLDAHWRDRGSVAVMPLMKVLTFDVMSTILFGLGRDAAVRWELSTEFQQLVQGIWAVSLNLPFTKFSRCLAASRRGQHAVAGVIEERRAKLERGESSPADDIITHMLSKGLPDEEITDNVMFLMVAVHDTAAALITFLLCHTSTPTKTPTPKFSKVVIYTLCGHYENFCWNLAGTNGSIPTMDDGSIRAGRDRTAQGARGGSVLGRPQQDEVHLGGGDGDTEEGAR